MKKLSKETAFNLKTGFGTLISNQSCIEAGRSLPWWIAIILGLIGSFIPVIPVMVSISKTNGETFISSTYNYSFDRNAAIATLQMKEAGIELSIDEDHYLTYSKNGEVQNPTAPELLAEYVNPVTNQYDVLAYWLMDNKTELKGIQDYYTELVSRQYLVGGTTPKRDSDGESTAYYTPTYLFFYKEGTAAYISKANTTTAANKFSGDFINVAPGKLITRLASVEGVTTPATVSELTPEYINGVYSNYKTFYNESYQAIKSRSLIYSTFIYWGIYLGLTLFLGLLIFLLTRGKRNFNNYLKWYECLSISGWACFTPGVLAMILGFLMTNYAIMFFILLMGVRIMWLSMKQLSPNYQQAQN